MTGITHAFVSTKSDGADNTVVQPSDWNAEHVIPDGYALLRVATATLTDTQIKNSPWNTTNLMAAPGAGKIILPICAFFSSSIVTTYTNIGDRCMIYFMWDSVAALPLARAYNDPTTGASLVTNLLTDNAFFYSGPVPSGPFSTEQGTYPMIGAIASVANKTVDLIVNNANGASFDDLGLFTGGDAANTLKITIIYTVIDL